MYCKPQFRAGQSILNFALSFVLLLALAKSKKKKKEKEKEKNVKKAIKVQDLNFQYKKTTCPSG